jgi:predicted ATPase/tRNA A-37 threonylcarbamoyl transferase component Bud32
MTQTLDPTLTTALAERYRLVREIGAGGMATVYLADDLRHQRQVAVKVLRPELAAAMGRERFEREITTTANLRHPNILPLFDSGGHDGVFFYVMPFIDGETLRDRLDRESQLPVDEAAQIADEIASALIYAHGRGVIHRDIKPENVLLENGHAVVADFGIAHALASAGDERLTSIGMSLGTPAYMSPEQSSGDVVDARSDLYALGCVMYEMLVGTPPFTGPNAMAVMARHLIDPVPSILTVRPNVSATINNAVARALAKAPADRFATLHEWRAAMQMHLRASTEPTEPTRAAALYKPPPTPSTALLGREHTLQQAVERVASGARVLTITGYGGTGKTRFAIELFNRLGAQYDGGSAFVSLASVTCAADVASIISIALDMPEAHGRSAIDALCTVIGSRRVLLVIDNFEQVLGAAGDVATLVSRCTALQIIATSRAPLKIGAESEFVLPPLELPASTTTSVDALLLSPAVALFVQRAQKVQPNFILSPANAGAVAGICRQLDGLPLALELAAARVRILEPNALLQRLDHALDLLTSGDRDLPLRQRTLRATISWSYSLLDAREQRLLRRVSVFHEGWTLDAMESACYDDAERYAALDELDSLAEKGLIRVIDAGARYALLETIRAFAAEQLHAAGEVATVRHAHATFYLALARDIAHGIKSDRQLPSMDRARAENANMLAAVQWLSWRRKSGESDALEMGLLMCGHLNWPFHITGLHMTMRELVDGFLAAAAASAPSVARCWALATSVTVCSATADLERGSREIHQAITDAATLGDDHLLAELYMFAGYVCLSSGRMDEAGAALDESIQRSTRIEWPFMWALATAVKGLLTFILGNVTEGIALVESARVVQRRIGDCEAGGMTLSFLAQMRLAEGNSAQALADYRDALREMEAVGDKPEIARVWCEMGWAELSTADTPAARYSFVRAVGAYEEVGSARGTGLALLGLAAVDAADGLTERAVAIAAASQALSTRAGIVLEHPMDPSLLNRIDALKASIPRDTLNGLETRAAAMSAAAVVAMVTASR